jgi:hypothetical protein
VTAYAAITKIHFTEPQVLQGGKVSVFDNGLRLLFTLLFTEMLIQPDSGGFLAGSVEFFAAFFSGMNTRQVLSLFGIISFANCSTRN